MARKIKKEGNYKKCWDYIKESKYFFLAVFLILLIAVLIGFFYPRFFVELIMKLISDLADKTKDMGFFQLFAFILENNITTAFLGLISGMIFGILPFFLVIFNGYVLGFVAGLSVNAVGYSVLLKLLPHGIFEIPALIISLGLGLKMARFIFAKNKKKTFIYDLENSLRVFLFVILPLLVIAAFIETGLIILFG